MDILPSPQQLRYLITLSELRHFGRAAQACFVTQSTLSAGILTMERQLNTTILDRSAGKRVIFTPLGEEVAAQARIALQALESVREVVNTSHTSLSSPLKLGIIPTIAPFLFSQITKKIQQIYPDLQFSIHEDMTERLMEKLSIGQLDLLIIAMPCRCEGAETFPLFKDEFYIALPKGHELERYKRVPIDHIPVNEVIFLQDGHCLRDQTLDMCRQVHNLKGADDSRIKFIASSLQTLVEMVAAGGGIAFLPRMAIERGLAQNEAISLRSLSGASTWRTIGLAWRLNSLRATEFKRLNILFQNLKNPVMI